MKIGIVLSNTPTESETFFMSKIKLLQDRGHQVVLFTNHREDFRFCKVITHPKVEKTVFFQLIRMVVFFSLLFLTRPIIFLRFLDLEKKDGVSFRTRLENLYINNHILSKKLD